MTSKYVDSIYKIKAVGGLRPQSMDGNDPEDPQAFFSQLILGPQYETTVKGTETCSGFP